MASAKHGVLQVAEFFGAAEYDATTQPAREKHWREHVRNLLRGMDPHIPPTLLLDPITAPQFIDRGQASFTRLLLLGLIFCSITVSWLTLYAVVVARVGDFLRRDRVQVPDSRAGTVET